MNGTVNYTDKIEGAQMKLLVVETKALLYLLVPERKPAWLEASSGETPSADWRELLGCRLVELGFPSSELTLARLLAFVSIWFVSRVKRRYLAKCLAILLFLVTSKKYKRRLTR